MRSKLLIVVSILVIVCAGLSVVLAQGGDTPITVGDGTLTLTSAVAWSQFTNPDAKTKAHPHTGKSVASVAVTMSGAAAANNKTTTFSGQRCEVTIRYANTDVVLSTGNNGRALKVVTDWASFGAGATAEVMQHNDASSRISRVIVRQGNNVVLDASPNGGTKVVVSYR